MSRYAGIDTHTTRHDIHRKPFFSVEHSCWIRIADTDDVLVWDGKHECTFVVGEWVYRTRRGDTWTWCKPSARHHEMTEAALDYMLDAADRTYAGVA